MLLVTLYECNDEKEELAQGVGCALDNSYEGWQ
jgi:hypothetical protein